MKAKAVGKSLKAFLAGSSIALGIPHATHSHHEMSVSAPVSGVSHDHIHEEIATERPADPVARFALEGTIIVIRTGPPPLSEHLPDTGTLLGNVPANDGIGVAESSGTAGHYRIKDREGRVLIQVKITRDNDGDENAILVDSNTVVAGGTLVFGLTPLAS